MTARLPPSLSILGTRGIPARHGGFETFAEHFACHLADRGWQVRVFCQEEGAQAGWEDRWQGVRLVHVPSRLKGPAGTVEFDLRCVALVLREPSDVHLTLGYNTALFSVLLRLRRLRNVFNMDGLEWKRSKWPLPVRGWFYLNEWLGCWLGNRLVADHPQIARHLSRRGVARKITMIPYGADAIHAADAAVPASFGLKPGHYALVVARAEPENSILEIVRAFSRRRRHLMLVVVGAYDPRRFSYHRKVFEAAGAEVRFIGPVYDRAALGALRFHARWYFHGHRVGGTNPSLLEAMAAGCAVLAHDNPFNRWVAGDTALYFRNEYDCAVAIERLLHDEAVLAASREGSRRRHVERFEWPPVMEAYERLLLSCCGHEVPQQREACWADDP
ncbi:MAG: DUF1972 domain-containing protein [Caenispirillum sp.]|nr:DUF1972 domain-containing protein [Caenispirillum sp.]